MSVATALLVTALIAFARWRERPLAARFEHALWTCVLAAMLAFAVPRVTVYAGPPVAAAPIPHAGPATMPMLPPPASPARPIPTSARIAPVAPVVDWYKVWSVVWLTGAVWMIVRIFVGIILTRRILAGARTILDEDAIQCAVSDHGSALCRVEESDNAVIPMTIGWPNQCIVLPVAWREWPSDKVRAVMVHELAHVRRRDTLVTFLAAVNKAIFWFHPLAWWLERRLSELAEFAADDAAVKGAPGIIDPQEYAAILVEIASITQPLRLRLSSSHASVDFARRGIDRINRRMERIFDSSGRTGSTKVVWAVATVIAVFSLVQFQRPVRAQEPPPRAQPYQPDDEATQLAYFAMKKLEELARRQQELALQQQQTVADQLPEQRDHAEALRLETEKLRQEMAQATDEQRKQLVDDATKKLQELAQRMQELAAQQQQTTAENQQQRWQAEMLRREAEQLQRQMEQQLSQPLAQLQNANRVQQDNFQAAAVSAASERLRALLDAREALKQRSLILPLTWKAEQLANAQQEFEQQLRKTFGNGDAEQKAAEQMAGQQAEMIEDYEQLQKAIGDAIGQMNDNQPELAKQLHGALGQAQQNKIEDEMRICEYYLRKGAGPAATLREAPITQAMDQLRDALKNAQQVPAARQP
jgi:beta-lactamase regulating signal transducer with metallopeptidase domain